MKSETFFGMKYLQIATKILATLFNVSLLVAAGIEIVRVFIGIMDMNIASAIQDGLFVLILLEMFYVVRSFIKYGSVNTALIISVGIVAIVKEVIFKLNTLDLNSSIAFTVLFLGFCIGFVLENRSHQIKVETPRRQRSLKDELRQLIKEKNLEAELAELIPEETIPQERG